MIDPANPTRLSRFSFPVANEVTPIAMSTQPPTFENRRTQTRRPLQTLTKIVFPNDERPPVIGFNRDLSWGGACLIVPDALPPAATTFQLMMSWKPDMPILANARLLRTQLLADGRTQLAVRFSQLTLHHHARLLEFLSQTSPEEDHEKDKQERALAPALEIVVNDPAQMQRLLAGIATGRQTLTVFHAYAVDQSISFSLTGMLDGEGDRLRARIVEVQPFQIADCDWTTLYRVTLTFEHPLASLKKYVERQLDQPIRLPSFSATGLPPVSAPGFDHEGSPV